MGKLNSGGGGGAGHGSNGNAYLTVGLPPRQRAALHHLTQRLSQAVTAIPKAQGDKPAGFDPMAKEGLHMTFVFCGKVLGGLPGSTLEQFHHGVTKTVANSIPPTSPTAGATRRQCTLRFRELRLFPPQKENLVVAVYEASPVLGALQKHTLQQAADVGVRTATAELDVPWVPHVTLGKIRAPKAAVRQVGRAMIAALRTVASSCLERPILPLGIELSGSTPKQRWLEWQFDFVDDVRGRGTRVSGETSAGEHKAEVDDASGNTGNGRVQKEGQSDKER